MVGRMCRSPAFASRYAGSPTSEGLYCCGTGVLLPDLNWLAANLKFSTVELLRANTQSTVAPRFRRFKPLVCRPRAVS